MPYEVLADTSVPKVVAAGRDPETNEPFEMRESTTYAAGAVIGDDAVAPDVKEKVEEGDERVSRLLRYISHDEAAKLRRQGSPGLQEVAVRDETPTDPNPHVPESAEISQYQEPVSVEPGSTAVAESPEVVAEEAPTPQEAATDAGVTEESSDSQEKAAEEETSDSQEEEAPKENKFAKTAAKKAPAKKAAAKKRTSTKK